MLLHSYINIGVLGVPLRDKDGESKVKGMLEARHCFALFRDFRHYFAWVFFLSSSQEQEEEVMRMSSRERDMLCLKRERESKCLKEREKEREKERQNIKRHEEKERKKEVCVVKDVERKGRGKERTKERKREEQRLSLWSERAEFVLIINISMAHTHGTLNSMKEEGREGFQDQHLMLFFFFLVSFCLFLNQNPLKMLLSQ